MQTCSVIVTHLQSILMRALQWSGVVCTVTNTHISTHTHTHKHNNVCLYCFSREQRHFQAEIIFSPAEYLPRMCIHVCVHEVLVFKSKQSPQDSKFQCCWSSFGLKKFSVKQNAPLFLLYMTFAAIVICLQETEVGLT